MPASIERVINQVSSVILGKEKQIRMALACLLARGHLLIEDVPGVGKTTLSQVIARSLGLEFQRIQFTSDLLPADILGVSVFNRTDSVFQFHPGPIFTQVILADEVNRATPKTQSALLEAMEEQQVTIEGKTRRLPVPFFVIATQNPSHQIGTFMLPESQMDRFMMRIHLGYPGREAERNLLSGVERREVIATLPACMHAGELQEIQRQVKNVHVSSALLDYIQAIIEYTRTSSDHVHGMSPRAGLALLAAARAWAFMDKRDQVLPEDIQTVLPHVVNHRLSPTGDHARANGTGGTSGIADKIIREIAIP